MQTINATLLGLSVVIGSVPQTVKELQIMQSSADEDAAFLSLMKPYLAARTYTDVRAGIIEAVIKGTGIPREDKSEADYMRLVRKQLTQEELPKQDIPYTAEETEAGEKRVEARLIEMASEALTFDFAAWESAPTERASSGTRKPAKECFAAAEAYLVKIRNGQSSFEQFNTHMAQYGIAPVTDGEGIVTEMAKCFARKTAAINAEAF
jgi:hypothetical protein